MLTLSSPYSTFARSLSPRGPQQAIGREAERGALPASPPNAGHTQAHRCPPRTGRLPHLTDPARVRASARAYPLPSTDGLRHPPTSHAPPPMLLSNVLGYVTAPLAGAYTSLTRRFSLLQKQTGDPSLAGLREGFAEQRARGAPNHITEEEEHMVLATLARIREGGAASDDDEAAAPRTPPPAPLRETDNESDYPTSPIRGGSKYSSRSNGTSPSTRRGGGSARPAKRYSNNLFGSGAFRDQTSYVRAGHLPRQSSSRSALSAVSVDARASPIDGLRAPTPEHGAGYGSAPSSPGSSSMGSRDDLSRVSPRSAPLTAGYPYAPSGSASGAVASRLSKTFTPSALKRVSMSLDEVLNRLEEAGEDEILVPRTAPPSQAISTERHQSSSSETVSDWQSGCSSSEC